MRVGKVVQPSARRQQPGRSLQVALIAASRPPTTASSARLRFSLLSPVRPQLWPWLSSRRSACATRSPLLVGGGGSCAERRPGRRPKNSTDGGILVIRVVRVNPNPNPKCRVPEFSGFDYFQQFSGCSFTNPKFYKPEKSDPKISDNSNAQPYLSWTHLSGPSSRMPVDASRGH